MNHEHRPLNIQQIAQAKTILDAIETTPSKLPEYAEQMRQLGIDLYSPIPNHTVAVDFKFKTGTVEVFLHDAPAIPRVFQAVHNGALRQTLASTPKFTDAIPKVGRSSTNAEEAPGEPDETDPAKMVFVVMGYEPPRADAEAAVTLLLSHGQMNLVEFMVLGTETFDRTSIAMNLLDTGSPAIAKELGESLLFCAQVARERPGAVFMPEFYTKIAMVINAGAELGPLRAYEARTKADGGTLLHALCQMPYDGHSSTWAFGNYDLVEAGIEGLTLANPDAKTKDFDIDQVDPATGKTALHYAVEFSSASVVKQLLAAGADPMAKVVSGIESAGAGEPARTAFSIANGARRQDVLQVLEAVTAQNAIESVLQAARARP